MQAKWMIDAYRDGRKAWDKLYMMREIDIQKYFEGFKYGREKTMFKEELDDLEKVYANAVNTANEQIADMLPSLLHYMEEFVCMHKGLEKVQEKLEVLREKIGENQEEKNDE
jgi:hypothetical protein